MSRIKLIANNQVPFLSIHNAINELETNPNYRDNKYIEVSGEWLDHFEEGLQILLDKLESNLISDTEIDEDLFDMFENMVLDPSSASSPEFWTSITLQSDTALEIIQRRWGHTEKFFRKKIKSDLLKESIYRRYGGNIYWQTFARIWWAAKYTPDGYKHVVFKQQDFLDKLIMNKYVSWDGSSNTKKWNSRTAETLIRVLGKFDEEKELNPTMKSVARQDVTRLVIPWCKQFQEGTSLELIDEQDLEDTIKEFLKTAVELLQND